jgi:uncharacterized membrane protein YphA (DoxX/SURF4 family)
MRLSLGAALIYPGAAILAGQSPLEISAAHQIIGVAAGFLLIAGLWTPVTATIAALSQILVAWSSPPLQPDGQWIHILLGALCASLAMLGPGAWSIDARLFGMKRFPGHRHTGHPPKE